MVKHATKSQGNSKCLEIGFCLSRTLVSVWAGYVGLIGQNAGFRHPGNTQKTHQVFLGKTRWKKNSKKPALNLIQFQFVVPAIIKDFLCLQLLTTNK